MNSLRQVALSSPIAFFSHLHFLCSVHKVKILVPSTSTHFSSAPPTPLHTQHTVSKSTYTTNLISQWQPNNWHQLSRVKTPLDKLSPPQAAPCRRPKWLANPAVAWFERHCLLTDAWWTSTWARRSEEKDPGQLKNWFPQPSTVLTINSRRKQRNKSCRLFLQTWIRALFFELFGDDYVMILHWSCTPSYDHAFCRFPACFRHCPFKY